MGAELRPGETLKYGTPGIGGSADSEQKGRAKGRGMVIVPNSTQWKGKTSSGREADKGVGKQRSVWRSHPGEQGAAVSH